MPQCSVYMYFLCVFNFCHSDKIILTVKISQIYGTSKPYTYHVYSSVVTECPLSTQVLVIIATSQSEIATYGLKSALVGLPRFHNLHTIRIVYCKENLKACSPAVCHPYWMWSTRESWKHRPSLQQPSTSTYCMQWPKVFKTWQTGSFKPVQ